MSSSYGDTAYDASQEQCARCGWTKANHYWREIDYGHDDIDRFILCHVPEVANDLTLDTSEENTFQAYDRSLAR